MKLNALGVDFGGVISDRVNDQSDTSFFGDNYLQTTAVPDAFDALRQLVERRFGDRVFVVSKCGPRVQEKTLQWLDHHRFYEITGVKREHVRFCRERRDKAGICRKLGISHFIDDRLSVLNHLTSVATLYLFNLNRSDQTRFTRAPGRIREVSSWHDILRHELP